MDSYFLNELRKLFVKGHASAYSKNAREQDRGIGNANELWRIFYKDYAIKTFDKKFDIKEKDNT